MNDQQSSLKQLLDKQREFFELVENFLRAVTGMSPTRLASVDDALARGRSNLTSPIVLKEADKIVAGLYDFYRSYPVDLLNHFQSLGGIKLLLGRGPDMLPGDSAFLQSSLAAVRKMVLYGDTIFIPDPLMGCIEDQAPDARHGGTAVMIANAYFLYQLKPLADLDLPYPAIFVYPSYERSLLRHDAGYQEGVSRLIMQVFGHRTGITFEHPAELQEYARTHEAEFISLAIKKGLFVPTRGEDDAIDIETLLYGHRMFLQMTAPAEYLARIERLPRGLLLLDGIRDKFAPQYHLLSNAAQMGAQPMLASLVHWHFYSLCADASAGPLIQERLLPPGALTTLRAMQDPNLQWLGNLPIDSLVELRRNGENVDFRKRMASYTEQLHKVAIDDIERTAMEIGRGVADLIVEHQRKVREISEKAAAGYKATAATGSGMAVTTLAATFVPALAPLFGPVLPVVSGAGVAGTYSAQKLVERAEQRKLSRSLLGVLAASL